MASETLFFEMHMVNNLILIHPIMKKLQKERGRRGKWMALDKAASTEEMDAKTNNT